MNDEITLPTELVRNVFDIAVESMDFSSGFLEDSDVEVLRDLAVRLGLDPVAGTPVQFYDEGRPVITAVPSQDVQAKAAEYLLGGRVRVRIAAVHGFVAHVTGSRPTPYSVRWSRFAVTEHGGGWSCDCLARTVCAHIVAAMAIWEPPADQT